MLRIAEFLLQLVFQCCQRPPPSSRNPQDQHITYTFCSYVPASAYWGTWTSWTILRLLMDRLRKCSKICCGHVRPWSKLSICRHLHFAAHSAARANHKQSLYLARCQRPKGPSLEDNVSIVKPSAVFSMLLRVRVPTNNGIVLCWLQTYHCLGARKDTTWQLRLRFVNTLYPLSLGLKKLCHRVKPSSRNAAIPAVRKLLGAWPRCSAIARFLLLKCYMKTIEHLAL